MNAILRQAGVIAFKHLPEGLFVLMITSRDTGRWVIPKGGIAHGFTAAQAAAQEALEEAGIKGIMSKAPLGIFTYNKRLASGKSKPAVVEVYALQVEKQLKKWPEKLQRRFEWMAISKAVGLVEEPGMITLLRRLEQIETARRIDHAHAPDLPNQKD